MDHKLRFHALVTLALAALAVACQPRTSTQPPDPSPLAVALAPLAGGKLLDRQIATQQRRVREAQEVGLELEKLGWLFIQRARRSADPGYYLLAEAAGRAMVEAGAPLDDAELIQGHALHSLHRFAQAEAIAWRLVTRRGTPFDYALLGDVLLDRGRVDEAIDAYQELINRRPDAMAYARAAQALFVAGNLSASLHLLELATNAAGPRNPEVFAWIWSARARHELYAGHVAAARSSAEVALGVAPDLAPALRIRGRVALAEDLPDEAVVFLTRAAQLFPSPDALWPLVEALCAEGRIEFARDVEGRLLELGRGTDPRGLALYLASSGQRLHEAQALANAELEARRDVYSYEAAGWVEAALGNIDRAQHHLERALEHGTPDPRLFYHAGLVATWAGDLERGRQWLTQAERGARLLFPTQRQQLTRALRSLMPADGRDSSADNHSQSWETRPCLQEAGAGLAPRSRQR